MKAIEAFREAVAQELKLPISDPFCSAADRLLMRIWLMGFKLVPVDDASDWQQRYEAISEEYKICRQRLLALADDPLARFDL